MKKIIIWGSGNFGVAAYHYYKEISQIVCFVDNNSKKWGTKIQGISIFSPDIIKYYKDIQIIIAVRNENDIKDIKNQLRAIYDIKACTLFSVQEEFIELDKKECSENILKDTIIVAFGGGLGNQMFQYAFVEYLQSFGKKVAADLISYNEINSANFILEQVFSQIQLIKCTKEDQENLIEQNKPGSAYNKFIIYQEPRIFDVEQKQADSFFLEATAGIFCGLFQSCRYAEAVSDILRNKFHFNEGKETRLKDITNYIRQNLIISVHIRRGDYLTEINKWIYGDICTDAYYRKAMNHMKKRYPDCQFCFFSNDIEWVKENFDMENNIAIEKNFFDDYEDWYDMYLMSLCKHNIIANSTFSWWGAWLNENKNKTVIAPQNWVNGCDYLDIYPDEWIKL